MTLTGQFDDIATTSEALVLSPIPMFVDDVPTPVWPASLQVFFHTNRQIN